MKWPWVRAAKQVIAHILCFKQGDALVHLGLGCLSFDLTYKLSESTWYSQGSAAGNMCYWQFELGGCQFPQQCVHSWFIIDLILVHFGGPNIYDE